jgi:uncharacterized protein (TIGR02391 family)
MTGLKKFDLSIIESISRVLGDTSEGFTGSEIGKLLSECRIPDPSQGITKWKRLFEALEQKQEQDGCADNVCNFIRHAMTPARHFNNPEWYSSTRYKINQILSFEGLSLGEDGILVTIQKASTLTEAAARASRLREKLLSRNVHNDLLKFCKEEVLVDNYFHAVFEATKSVAEKIRQKTGLTSDGSNLVDEAFSFQSSIPHLALNSLRTDSEQSEQRGFMNLLKGLFGTFRNTTAHAPKITWKIEEQDALDILSLVSLIHRRLDNSVEEWKGDIKIISK